MKGCGGQEYAVAPVDPEGDTVRCRWSSSSESHDMAWFSMLTQFSLDQDTCAVTYHPENDQATTGGSKAISVQVEVSMLMEIFFIPFRWFPNHSFLMQGACRYSMSPFILG
jgi:hypothetical protein